MTSAPFERNDVRLEFGPGSMEYEITADFLQHSLANANYPVITQLAPVYLSPSTMSRPKRQWGLNSIKIKPTTSNTEKASEIASTYESTITERYSNYGRIAFFSGFVLPFIWWIFAFFPSQPATKYQAKWRFWNRILTLISITLLCIFLPLFLTIFS
ncbi:hypothetical protein K7432_018314 [Basidiobolus ranarum]|uniref:Gamma-secretase subunit PEN-2 n=1 Tax=Basidiobolus ranarum TaxID=34480 RepID=A0ABR2WCC4_9FUNG